MGKVVKLGMIGLGARAETLLATLHELRNMDIEVTAICDIRQEKIDRILEIMAKRQSPKPATYLDYRQLIASDNVDAVLVPTSWNSHLKIAEEAMAQGKYAGIEVGGASSIDELWHLVHAAESRPRLQLILQTICGTGIRVSELVHITVEAVRQGEAVVRCKGKVRTILFVRELQTLLLEDDEIETENPFDDDDVWD